MNEKRASIRFIERCYKLYEQKMYHVAYCILRDEGLAEDAVQEAFLKLMKSNVDFKDAKSDECKQYIITIIKHVLIAQPVNIEVMISNRGIESVFVSGIMDEPDVCNANVDIIGEKEITEALNKKFGDVILTDEYKVTNIWMEYFPLLQNDSFTDIKLIPVWCLDFEVNGNGAEDGGYTIRINAITGDEIA